MKVYVALVWDNASDSWVNLGVYSTKEKAKNAALLDIETSSDYSEQYKQYVLDREEDNLEPHSFENWAEDEDCWSVEEWDVL